MQILNQAYVKFGQYIVWTFILVCLPLQLFAQAKIVKLQTSALDGTDRQGIVYAEIETERLILRSIGYGDANFKAGLYANSKNLKLFLSGTAIPRASSMVRTKQRADRWHAGNPFSSFVVMLKPDSLKIGEAICGGGYAPGEASLALVIHHLYQNKGYGKEIVAAFREVWLPKLLELEQEVNGAPLSRLHASARVDNFSSSLLNHFGFQLSKLNPETGCDQAPISLRQHYQYDVSKTQVEDKDECKK